MTDSRIDREIQDSGAGQNKNYAQKWITSISTTDFLNLTLSGELQNRDVFDAYPGDYGSTVNDYDYVEALKKEKRQTPFLSIDENGNIIGHEGRHRIRALEKSGIRNVEIVVKFYDNDGYLIKNKNSKNGRLESIRELTIFNQKGTGQTAAIKNIVPFNLDHKEEILSEYGESKLSNSDVQ